MEQDKVPIIPVEEQFKIMANSARMLIWILGTDKLCCFFNDGWLRFTGRTLEQEYGNEWVEGIHPDDLDPSKGSTFYFTLPLLKSPMLRGMLNLIPYGNITLRLSPLYQIVVYLIYFSISDTVI